MVVQRKTQNLGFNRSKANPKIYNHIERVLKIREKFCGRGNRGELGQFKLSHEGKNPVPIRNFYLNKAYLHPVTGEVIIDSKDGLQGACIACDKAFRKARIIKNRNIYSKLTKQQIYDSYRKNYQELKRCSQCHIEKKPEEFPISQDMETGLHNTCKQCSKAYSESVGGRWIIYSVDGHKVMNIADKDVCKRCGSKINLHKDHIFPISRGGTDNEENLQVLCGPHNLSKTDTIPSSAIESIEDIKDEMICERYRWLLYRAKKEKWSLERFGLEITGEVRKFIDWKKSLTDQQLGEFFEKEKQRNNRKHSVPHAIRKFREYCEVAYLDPNKQIFENDKESRKS